jgi:hypothetical protein
MGTFDDLVPNSGNFDDLIPQQTKPGFADNVSADVNNRAVQAGQTQQSYRAGEISKPEEMLQLAGTGAGLVTDVGAEALKSGASAAGSVLPESVKQAGAAAYDSIVHSRIGQAGLSALHSGVDSWKEFSTYHPRMARDIEGAVNLGFIAAPGIKYGEAALGAGGEAVSGAVKAGATAAKTVADKAGDVASALTPQVNEGLRDTAIMARKYNIPLSYDQITDSKAIKNAQKVSQELPLSGQAAFREKQLSAWNRQVLKTVGIDGDKFTKANMDKAFNDVGSEFDSFGKGQTYNLNHGFLEDINKIRSDAASTASKDSIGNFDATVKKVQENADAEGNIPGQKLNALRSQINALARKASNPDTQTLLHDLENSIIDTITTNDPKQAAALSAAKQKYKNLLVIEPLAAKAKAGNISPALLNDRVFRVYGRSHVRGSAGEIGDLAQIGHELLPELGGSDTVQKSIYANAFSTLTAAGSGAGYVAGGPAGVAAANIPLATASGVNRALQSGLNRNQGLIDKALGITKSK